MSQSFDVEFEFESDRLAEMQGREYCVLVRGSVEVEAEYGPDFNTPIGSPTPAWGSVGYVITSLVDENDKDLMNYKADNEFAKELSSAIDSAIEDFISGLDETPAQMSEPDEYEDRY